MMNTVARMFQPCRVIKLWMTSELSLCVQVTSTQLFQNLNLQPMVQIFLLGNIVLFFAIQLFYKHKQYTKQKMLILKPINVTSILTFYIFLQNSNFIQSLRACIYKFAPKINMLHFDSTILYQIVKKIWCQNFHARTITL